MDLPAYKQSTNISRESALTSGRCKLLTVSMSTGFAARALIAARWMRWVTSSSPEPTVALTVEALMSLASYQNEEVKNNEITDSEMLFDDIMKRSYC